MDVIELDLPGIFLFKPQIYRDERGYFLETFSKHILETAIGYEVDFVQDNESMSSNTVLRGLHFQEPPHAQAKLVRVVKGKVTDVCVDIRSKSATYGKHLTIDLSEEDKNVLFIPTGIAHGFITRDDRTVFSYKCSSYYNKASENSLLWDDPDLAIDWHEEDPIVSAKDQNAGRFSEFSTPF